MSGESEMTDVSGMAVRESVDAGVEEENALMMGFVVTAL